MTEKLKVLESTNVSGFYKNKKAILSELRTLINKDIMRLDVLKSRAKSEDLTIFKNEMTSKTPDQVRKLEIMRRYSSVADPDFENLIFIEYRRLFTLASLASGEKR